MKRCDALEGLLRILRSESGGAAELMDHVFTWLQANPNWLVEDDQPYLLHALRTGRPSMAGFTVFANRLDEALATHPRTDPGILLKRLRTDSADSGERVVQNAVRELSPQAPFYLVTLSMSSTVLKFLQAAREMVVELHVLASNPGGEGRELATRAHTFLGKVILHEDEDLRHATESSNVGILGADTVFSDGAILNKVRSVDLALALQAKKAPCYALTTTWKYSDLDSSDWVPEERDGALFEVVPSHLLTRIITD